MGAGLRALSILLLAVACGCTPAPPVPPLPLSVLRAADSGERRLEPVRRLLRMVREDGSVPPFRFLGRHLTPLGATARVAYLAFYVEDPAVVHAVSFTTTEAGAAEDLPVLDAALALQTLALWLPPRSPLRHPGRASSRKRMIDLLLAKQADDGTWGSPIDTAFAIEALSQADRGAAPEWRERCRAYRDGLGHDLAAVERIAPAPLDRIHLAAVVAMLTERPGPVSEGFALDDQRFLRSIVSTAFTELSPDVFSAAGDLFLVLCPDSDPDNPVAPVVREFRRRFEGEGLPAHDFGEEVALVYALHALGYDSFGPVWGYLMGDTMWEPAGD